jgi:hypothetical protein
MPIFYKPESNLQIGRILTQNRDRRANLYALLTPRRVKTRQSESYQNAIQKRDRFSPYPLIPKISQESPPTRIRTQRQPSNARNARLLYQLAIPPKMTGKSGNTGK